MSTVDNPAFNPPDPDNGGEPYVSADRLRQRLQYQPGDFFRSESANSYKLYDELLERLATEATAIVDNHTGDQTWWRETDRQDVIQVPSGRILNLVHPVVEVTEVERARVTADGDIEWRSINPRRWQATSHGVKLRRARRLNRGHGRGRPNPLLNTANAMEWDGVGSEIRVTYTRGFEEIPEEIQNIVTDLVRKELRRRKMEENIAASNPQDLAGVSPEWDKLIDEPMQERLDGLTTLTRGTYTV